MTFSWTNWDLGLRGDLSELHPLRFPTMVRKPRLDVPDGFYHVLALENRAQPSFMMTQITGPVTIDRYHMNSSHAFLSDEATAIGGSLRNAWTRSD